MRFIDKLERKFDNIAIHNLTLYLIIGQAIFFFIGQTNPNIYDLISLNGSRILSGEYWRLISFIFLPFRIGYVFAAFVWYLYYLYGTALENSWGAFKYNLFVLISIVSTISASLIFPDLSFTNSYLYLSIFLAFAHLFPDFQLMLFFIIPVKVKWFAYIAWMSIIWSILFGNPAVKILAVVSVFNFLIFFAEDIYLSAKLYSRKLKNKTLNISLIKRADHVCKICKKNEIDNPDMLIYYCDRCNPNTCYCEEHVDNHKHLK